jgi:hypothetical protein
MFSIPLGGKHLETHGYDGKWKTECIRVFNKMRRIPLPSFDACIQEISSCITMDKCDPKIKKHAYQTLTMMKDSPSENYDGRNGVSASDLLRMVWYFVRTDTSLSQWRMFLEQMSDISSSGPCPQGRSTRLFQLLLAFADEPDNS